MQKRVGALGFKVFGKEAIKTGFLIGVDGSMGFKFRDVGGLPWISLCVGGKWK